MTTLNDLINSIDQNFPYPNVDNPSQGFRDNFYNIKFALTDLADPARLQIPLATTGIPGLVIVGDGLKIDYTGVLSVDTTQTVATANILGNIKIGSGVSVSSSGTISIATASPTTLGLVKTGAGVEISVDGTISVNTGTPYVLGPATYSTLGGIKVGSGLTIDGNGFLSATTFSSYALPAATNFALGGVIIGNGIDVAPNGLISVNTGTPYVLAAATTSTLGGVIVGDSLSVFNGTINVPPASKSSLGIVQIGNGIEVSPAGVLSVNTGSFDGGIINNALVVHNFTQSASTNSGAVVIEGGLGVAGNAYLNRLIVEGNSFTFGQSFLENQTNSNSTSSGAVVVTGGVGIGENLNVGGSSTLKDTVLILSNASNALTVQGGISVGGNFNVTGTSVLNGNATANSNLGVGGNFNVTGTATVSTVLFSAGGFSILQSGTKLLFEFNNNVIASLSSGGTFTSLSSVVPNGTP